MKRQEYHIMSYYYEHEVLVQYPNGDYRFISSRDEWESNTTKYRDTFTKKEVKAIKKIIRFDRSTDYLYPLHGFRNWLYKKRQ